MVVLHHTNNYEEFTALMKNLEPSKKPIFVLFMGSPNENGESWCSDCVEGNYDYGCDCNIR